jgi:hypothetical protein
VRMLSCVGGRVESIQNLSVANASQAAPTIASLIHIKPQKKAELRH